MKISRNPQIAYQQGFKEGLEQRRSNDTVCGFEFMQALLPQVFYNCNEETKFLSLPKLAEFYEIIQERLEKLKNEYIEPDGTISNSDKVDLLWSRNRFVEKKFAEAMEKRNKKEAAP